MPASTKTQERTRAAQPRTMSAEGRSRARVADREMQGPRDVGVRFEYTFQLLHPDHMRCARDIGPIPNRTEVDK